MPELPEVESFRKFVDEHALDQKIECIHLSTSKLLWKTTGKALKEALVGNKLVATQRHGKFLFVELNQRGFLLFHFGMTGDFHYGKASELNHPSYILSIQFTNNHVLLFSDSRMFGEIALIESVEDFIQTRGYGPDALQIGEKEFVSLMSQRKAAVKTVLMNQKMLAGVGNEFSDAILFQCRIHPLSQANSLKKEQVEEMHSVMKKILKEAVKVDADRSKLNHYFLLNQRKAGLRCVRCNGKTEWMEIGGRSSYFCPSCQKLYSNPEKTGRSLSLFEQ